MNNIIPFDKIENIALASEQSRVQTLHHFYPGIYIREINVKAGDIILGHYHKTEHTCQLLQGELELLNLNGNKILKAPWMSVASEGRKCALITEDVVWLNIFANPKNIQDVETLESIHLDITQEFNTKLPQVNKGKIYTNKINKLPFGIYKFRVRNNRVYATADIKKDEVIGYYKKTVLQKYTQHQIPHNCYVKDDILYAKIDIIGCKGGFDGDEITILGED